jgi:ureidoacrylate peracid hydrolase
MHKVEIPQVYIDRIIHRAGRAHLVEALDGPTTALVVIDMQNFFMDDAYAAACPVARDIVPNINALADATRHAGGLVVWVRMVAPPGSDQSWSAFHERFTAAHGKARLDDLAAGAAGYALWDGMDVGDGDEVVDKNRYSAFIKGASEIEPLLRGRGIETLVFTGVATNVCVESSARDAMMLNFRTLMVSDGCATKTDAEHNATLAIFHTRFGDVRETAEVIEMLEQSATGKAAAAAAE